MISYPVNQRAIQLAGRAVTSSDRVLITGASGWFGQTASVILDILEIPTLLIGSSSREIDIAGVQKIIHVWNLKTIEDFAPTVVIDCAYLTREMVEVTGLDTYVEVNRKLVQQILELKGLKSLRLVVSFSSGAAEINRTRNNEQSIEIDPYGFLKVEQEELLQAVFNSNETDLVIARVWNVSGSLVTKINGFAFSDLISQSLNGRIEVSSNFEVWRSYCMIEEVLAVSLNGSQGSENVFDTGGRLIEINELAKLIQEIVNPKADLVLPSVKTGVTSSYFSDGKSWNKWCRSLNFKPIQLEEQIEQVAGWMKNED
jgi:nucleoside-diphosphate-sugar epimerase